MIWMLLGLLVAARGWVLQDDYSPSYFLDMFEFFNGPDPTDGFVIYLDQAAAIQDGLVQVLNDSIYIGADYTNITPQGRPSVRLVSKAIYNHGLVVLDLAHMPGGICGTWPAFWLVGPQWPQSGEIDIVEGVNTQQTNSMTLHTSSDCFVSANNSFSGTLVTSNCNVAATGQAANVGCRINAADSASFGTGFNQNGGGVFAMRWTSSGIDMWFFPRDALAPDVLIDQPLPEGWGQPMASFRASCDLDSLIRDQQLVFDLTFCGQWAGAAWSTDTYCAPLADTCQDFVQSNPGAFVDAFWRVNSLRVFQQEANRSTNALFTPSVSPVSVQLTSSPISGFTGPYTTVTTGIIVPPFPLPPCSDQPPRNVQHFSYNSRRLLKP